MWYPALTKAKRPSPHIQASDSSITDQLTESAKATEPMFRNCGTLTHIASRIGSVGVQANNNVSGGCADRSI